MLEHEIASKNIKRVKASIGGPKICHVMYADDIVLFSKATRRDAAKINDCIEKYCNWSKQKLNINNYGFFFSKYTHNQPRRFIKQVLQMKGLKQDAIYLGAPLFLSRALSKVGLFSHRLPPILPPPHCPTQSSTTGVRRNGWQHFPRTEANRRGELW